MSDHNEEQEVVEKPATHKKKAQAVLIGLLALVLIGLFVDILTKSGGDDEKPAERQTQAAVRTTPLDVRSFDQRVEDAKKRKAYEQERTESLAPKTAQEVVEEVQKNKAREREERLGWTPKQKEKTPAEIYLEAEQMRAFESRRSSLLVQLDQQKEKIGNRRQDRPGTMQQPEARGLRGERSFIQDELRRVRGMQEQLVSGQAPAQSTGAGFFNQGQAEPATAKTSADFEVGKPVAEQGQPKPGQVLLPTGTVITAALDQMVMSDVTGSYRAIVTRDVYDVSGTYVLIPKGAKLTGRSIRLKGVNEPIQNRMILTNNWCVLPNGKRVSFEKTVAMDAAGVAALKDKVNYHLIPQILGVAAYAVLSSESSRSGSGANQDNTFEGDVSSAMREQFAPLAAKYLSLVPTVTLRAGTPMRVFIEDDVFITPWDRVYAGLIPRG